MIDPSDEDYIVRAEQLEEVEEEEKRGCFRTVVLIVIIILLLLLFWPVKPGKKGLPKSNAKEEQPKVTGDGVIGEARYKVLKSETIIEVNGRRFSTYKGTALGVEFRINNLSRRDQTLDFSMLKVSDQFGNQFVPTSKFTAMWYSEKKLKSPWGEAIKGNGSKNAFVIFFVYPGPPKKYNLLAKGFDWRLEDFIAIDLGTIDALPKN